MRVTEAFTDFLAPGIAQQIEFIGMRRDGFCAALRTALYRYCTDRAGTDFDEERIVQLLGKLAELNESAVA